MWRDFPFFTIVDKTDPSTMPKFKSLGTKGMYCGDEPLTFLGRIDQITKVLEKLKNNPDDRRMIVSAWHPHWVDHCALPPCHCLFHFHTEELTLEERIDILQKQVGPVNLPKSEIWIIQKLNEENIPTRGLNCLLYQRSVDTALGKPFNIASYALLTAMIAQTVNMVPGMFTHSMGDTHIYVNHIDGLKLQLTREPKKLPRVWLNPEVKSLFDFKYDDIKLLDYEFHPTIKFDVAV
jgi:thymidylate synthase